MVVYSCLLLFHGLIGIGWGSPRKCSQMSAGVAITCGLNGAGRQDASLLWLTGDAGYCLRLPTGGQPKSRTSRDLGFSQSGGWASKGSIPRVNVPKDPGFLQPSLRSPRKSLPPHSIS